MSSARARRVASRTVQAAALDTAMPASIGALAVRLVGWANEAGDDGLIHIADNQRRATALAKAARGLAPELDTVLFPAWDCLPYDRASPSSDIMGQRMAALRVLARRKGACLVVAVAEAVAQRVPPQDVVLSAGLRLAVGDSPGPRDGAGSKRASKTSLYVATSASPRRAEFALRGQVLDTFRRRKQSVRAADLVMAHRDDRRFDPVSQLHRLRAGRGDVDPIRRPRLVGSGAAGADRDQSGQSGREPSRKRGLGAAHWPAAVLSPARDAVRLPAFGAHLNRARG
jgi:transcription-repair coupling factor (superfamily II helicase)